MPLLLAPEKQIGLGTSMTLSDPCEEAASSGTPFVMPHYFLDVRFWHVADITLDARNVRFGGKADIAQTCALVPVSECMRRLAKQLELSG